MDIPLLHDIDIAIAIDVDRTDIDIDTTEDRRPYDR